MKKSIISLFSAFILLITFSFAQSQNTQYGVWELMIKKDGIEIYGKHDLCLIDHAPNDYHFFSVKLVNTNSVDKEVAFYIKNYYQEGESGHKDENMSMVTLKPGEVLEGTCFDEDATLTRMISNPQFKGGWKYIKTEIIFESIN